MLRAAESMLSLAFGCARWPQRSFRGKPNRQSPEARREAGRFDNSRGKQALITRKMKNQAKAKKSNGEAFASSMRAANRKPRKPATPNTVTARFAIGRARSLVLRPMKSPSMLTMEGWSRRHRKTSRMERFRYKRDIKIARATGYRYGQPFRIRKIPKPRSGLTHSAARSLVLPFR